MSWGNRSSLVLALALAFGCESDPMAGVDAGPGFEPACGEDCVYLIGALRVPREGEPVPGLDLDGRVSDASDELGCGHPDAVAPDGRAGIDNQFAGLIGTLEEALGEDADEALQASIAGGDFLFLVELEDHDSGWGVRAGPAEPTGELALEPSGEPSAGQTFAFTEMPHAANASVGGSVVEATLGDISVHFAFESSPTTMLVREARLRVPFVDGLPTTGTLAGRLSVDDLLPTGTGGPLGDPSLVRDSLEEQADLDPDGAGVCQSISIAFAMDLVPAQLAP